MNREEAYLAFQLAANNSGLNAHIKNKKKVNQRICAALVLLSTAGLMPYLHLEIFWHFELLSPESVQEWIKRSGSIVIVLAIAAEFLTLEAKDIAGLGGHTGFGPYGPGLIKHESKGVVSVLTGGVAVQLLIGTLIASHGDIVYDTYPLKVWIFPAIAALITTLSAGLCIYRMRPILRNWLTTGHE